MKLTDDPSDNHPFRTKMQHAMAGIDDDRLRELKRHENRMDILGARLEQLVEELRIIQEKKQPKTSKN